MGIKIGKNTLLAGNTVLNTGEQVNVSRAAAGDTKAPLAMAVTSASGSPAYDPAWLNDPKGIVNVAMAQAMIEASGTGGGAFDSVFNVSIGTQNRVGAKETDKIIELASYSGWIISSLGDIDVDAVQNLNMKGKRVGVTAAETLTLKDSTGTYFLSDLARESAFDGVFDVTDSGGKFLESKDRTKKTTLSSQGGWDILANGDVYICSYAGDLMLSGGRVSLGTSNYMVLDANGDNVSLTARGILTLSDSTGNYSLSDLAGGSVSYQTRDGTGTSDWYNVTVAAGWYKVDVLLRSDRDQSVNYNVFRYMASNMKAVRCVAWSNSGAPSVLIEPSAGFLPNITTCRVLQMSFLWLAPGGKQDWAGTDIAKFDWGSITYTAIPTPTRITS